MKIFYWFFLILGAALLISTIILWYWMIWNQSNAYCDKIFFTTILNALLGLASIFVADMLLKTK